MKNFPPKIVHTSLLYHRILWLFCFFALTSGSIYAKKPAAVIIDPNNGTTQVNVAYSNATAGLQLSYTTAGNGTFKLTMPSGVTYVPGSMTFTSSAGAVIAQSNITNLAAPVFSITGATVGGNSIISYKIKADCATQGSASIAVSVTVGASTDAGSISITILKAAITVDAHNTVVTYQRAGNASSTITLTNGGNGKLDSLLFYIDQNSLLVTDSVKVNGVKATQKPTVGDTLFYQLSAVHFPGGTLDNGESIIVTRYFHAPVCYSGSSSAFPNFQSQYFANFGRGSNRCQSPTPSDFGQYNFDGSNNADPTATITEVSRDRLATACQTALVRYRYTAGCSGTNTTFCKAYNLFFLIWNGATGAGNTGWLPGEYNIKSVKLVSNGASIPVAFTSQYAVNLLNSAAVQGTDPDGAGVGLEDLDADGYYDDILPGQTFDIIVEWERIKQAACANNAAPHRVYISGRASNQCGQSIASPQVSIINGNLYPSGSILMLASPSELSTGQTGTTQTQINRTAPSNTYLSCTTNQFSLRFPLAAGMTVTAMRAGTTNLTFTVVNDTAVAVIPTATSNPFISDIDFKVTPGVTPSGTTPKVILSYICDSSCPNSREDVACLDGPPIIIPVPGPCPNGGASTSNSSVLRMTTGFTTYQHTARVPLASITLPSRKRGLPCDSVLVTSTGTVNAGLVITGGEPLYYQISYSLHGGVNRLFNWAGGTYTYQGTTVALPAPAYEANNGGSHIAIYSLGSFPAGAVVNVSLYGVEQDAATLTSALEIVPSFNNTFFNLDDGFSNPAPPTAGDTRYGCGGQALEFYVRNPRGAFSFSTPGGQVCDNITASSKRYYLRGTAGSGVEIDYFPGEIRPMIQLDSIVVTLPVGWSYVPGGDVLRVWGNSNEGGFPSTTTTGISQTIGAGTVIGNKVKWVNPGNWNVPDDALQGGYEFSFTNDRPCTAVTSTITTLFYGKQNANTRDLTNCPKPIVLNNGGVQVTLTRPVITVTNLTGTKTALQQTECFNFNLNIVGTGAGTNVNLPFAYIYFPGGGGNFTVTSFKNTTTGASYPILNVAGGQWVQLGLLQHLLANNFSGTNFPFTICAEYASCTNPDIQYVVSWGCDGYPTNPAVSGCATVSGFFDLALVPSGIQASFVKQPVSPVNLCDPLVYEFNTLSTLAANLINPRLQVTIPTGMSISQVRIEYPLNSGNYQTVTPSATTGVVTIPYSLHTAVHDSLPGVATSSTTDPRTAKMELSFATDCNFTSGSRISILAKGEEPCGNPAQGNNTLAYSDPITINGISQNYIALVNNLNVGADSIITCSNRKVSLDMVLINTSASPVTLDPSLDSVLVSFPQGIQYVAGTYTCTSTNCFLPPVVNSTTGNLSFGVPAGIVIPGGGSITMSFSYDINALVNEGCGVPGGMTVSMVRSIAGIGCASQPGGVCPNPVKFISGSKTVNLVSQKANVQNINALICKTGTNQYSYNGSFTINQGVVPTLQSLLVETYCLNAGVPSGAPVSTQTVNGLLNSGSGAINFSGTFTSVCSGDNFRVSISPVTNGGVNQCSCAEVHKDLALSNPTFTVTAGAACAGDVLLNLPLNSITNGGNTYKVDFADASIPDITTAAALPVDGILVIPIPSTLASGTYTGTVTLINSTTLCEGSAPFSFVVNANPTATITTPICLNGTGTIVGSGTKATINPYVSANDAIATVTSTGSITAISAGTTIITYTNNLGCKVQKSITVNELPTLTGGNVCVGSSNLTLTGSGTPATTNPYVSANTAIATISSTGVVTGVSAGTTTITYTDSFGCQATASVTVSALPTLAGEQICVGETLTVLGSGIPNSTNPYVSSNPAIATVTNGGLVTGISAGTVTITYTNFSGCQIGATVVVNAKPNAGTDKTACVGTDLILTGTANTGTWTAQAGNPAGATVGSTTAGVASVSFATTALGDYHFIYTVNSCTDTVKVTVNPKPNAGADQTVCAGTSATLTGTANTGTWTAQAGNPAGATVGSTTSGVANVSFVGTTSGAFNFIYTAGSCTDTVQVTVTAKPNAGTDQIVLCSAGSATTPLQLTGTPASGTWSAVGNNPTGVSISSSGLVSFTNPTAQNKSFNFIYTLNGCADTVTVTVPNCNVASTIAIANACQCFDVEYFIDEVRELYQEIKVTANSGQSWVVIGQTGMLALDSLVKRQVNIGESLVETPVGSGTYILPFTSEDNIPYYVQVTNGTDTLSIANVCTNGYPPINWGVLPAQLCRTASAITLTATSTDPALSFQFFRKNRQTGALTPITTLDPSTFAVGDTATIVMRATGGAKCPSTISQNVIINNTDCQKGSLGDLVWVDIVKNGQKDASESGVAGIIIQLYKDGNLYAVDTTDANGKYLFTNLDAGLYKIKIVQSSITNPSLSISPLSNIGNDASDSDVNSNTGESGVYEINPPDPTKRDILTVDAALQSSANQPTCSSLGTIGGTVFNDQNNNGVFNTTDSLGFAGIKVYAYNCLGVKIDSAVTDAKGKYTFFNVTAGTDSVRVEFDKSTFPSWAKPTYNGADGNTDVQFVKAPNCSVDLGLADLDDYCQANPLLVTTCFLSGVQNNNLPAVVGLYYNTPEFSVPSTVTKYALGKDTQVGSTYGVAFQRSSQTFFVSSMVRHYYDYGPGGFDAIYPIKLTDNNFDAAPAPTSTVSPFFKLSTLGVNVGTNPRTTITGTTVYNDGTVYQKVGKVGIGDIDLSSNGDTLFVVNLNEAAPSLVLVNVANPSSPTLITEIPLPAGQCVGGKFAPWGLKYHRGKIYVGGVCNAETSLNKTNLDAFVYRWDGGTTFTQVATMDMDYPRSAATFRADDSFSNAAWRPWSNTWNPAQLTLSGGDLVSQPQPILQDIEFDSDGSMILGFGDRFSYQTAYGQRRYDQTTGSTVYSTVAAGDIIKFCNVNGTLVKEGTATSCSQTISDVGSTNLPTVTDFNEYFDDNYINEFNTQAGHAEVSLGALVKVPGKNGIVMSTFDPIKNQGPVNTSGLRFLNSNGTYSKGWVYVTQNDQDNNRKGGSLGDIEAACAPLPIQIGNRLWVDTDKDGVQDPCKEAGIANMVVSLYNSAGVLIGKDTTNAKGEYYFDVTNVVDTVGVSKLNFLGPQPKTQYYIAIGKEVYAGSPQFNTSTGAIKVAGIDYKLTTTNSIANGGNDQNDSDFNLGTTGIPTNLVGYPVLLATTPSAGADHTFDAGFVCIPPKVAVSPKTQNVCVGTNAVAYTATSSPSTGISYKWYGPLADTLSGLGNVIAGQTTASYTPSNAEVSVAGTKYFAVKVFLTGDTTCADTAYVQLIINAKPNAGTDQSICQPASTAKLTGTATGGTWTVQTGNPSSALVDASGNVTGMTSVGTYNFIYTLSGCADTVSVTITAKPSAGVDQSICQPATTAKLTGTSSGGTWTAQTGNPSTAIVDASGNVTGMSSAGSYNFIYTLNGCADTVSVTVTAKPNAGTDQTLACVNAVNNTLATSTTLVPSPAGGTWLGLSSNPAVATISGNAVSGMSVAGTYQFEYSLNGCKDTVSVTVEPCAGCVKPNAGNDVSICSPATTVQLTAVTSGGTWTAQTGNPSTASIDANGNVTGMTVAGVYKFIYSVTGGGQTCTDTAQVEVKAKPNAGTDQSICQPASSAKLTGTASGGTWTVQTGNPSSALVDASGNITGMSSVGTYNFIYTLNGCADTVSVTVTAKPSAGADQSICQPASTAKLTGTVSGGTWTAQTGNPSTAIVDASGNVTGMSSVGTYNFIYTLNGCADTVSVTVTAKPNAGTDQTLACVNAVNNTLATSTTLVPSPAGGTWLGLSSNPAVVPISGNAVSGMSVAGTYQFEYTLNGCKDTVSVTVEPCAGCVKPNAGNDISICSPATTAQLTAVTTGGTWTAQTGNPSTASIDANGNVTGMTVAGVYKFIYSVTGGGQTCSDTAQVEVKAKPNAGTDQTLACVNAVNNTLATSTTLVPSPSGGTWLGLSSNPAVATISGNAVSGMSVAGTYQFEYTLNGCKDTVTVTVEPCAGCVKPNAGNDVSICSPATTAQLTAVTSGGTWTAQTGNPTNALIGANGNVTGMTTAGIYKFIYSVTGGGQTCTDTAQVEVKAKPNAGTDQTLACVNAVNNTLATSTTLVPSPSGGTWLGLSSNPAVATISGNAVSDMSVAGTYQFEYSLNGCKDTVSVTVEPCAGCVKPNAGNDVSICSPATTAQLTAVTSGGTWTAQMGNPTSASIDANGNVIGMTTAGIYEFIYSVTGGGQTCTDTAQVEVKAKPNAGTDQTLACVNAVNNTLATSTTLVPSPSGGTWLGLSSNPAVATISGNAVSGMSVAGTYQFEYSLNGCKDTVSVTVEPCAGCVKPNAGNDVSICSPATTAQLTAVTSGGTWTAQTGNPTTANIDANGNVTGMTAAGVYKFIYSVTGGGQTCTDTAQVEVKAKPNAGTDQTLACVNAVNNTLATSTTLVPSPSGGTWLGLSSNPAVATISGNAVSDMSVAGTYQFEYSLNGCKDTVSVTVEPCAGCVKPNAGNDVSICSPATTAQLTAVTSGGTWTAQTGNPTNALIGANGNVTGMTTAGVYKFIYSVTGGGQTCSDTAQVEVKAKPNAGTDQTLACVNAVNNTLATSTMLVPSPAGGTWLGLSSNPAVVTISGNAVSGMSVAGTYQFEYTLNGCKDTVSTTIEPCAGCVKPNAGNDISICSTATTAQLTAVTTGGTWTAQTGNPTTASIDVNGNVTEMTTAGIYKFIYSVTGGGQTCTDTAQVEVKAKPNAGTDQTLACVNAVNNTLATSTTLVPSPSGGTWLGLSSNPAVATISGNAVSGMSVAGTYQFEYTLNGCKDTVTVTVEPCAGCVKPNAGNDVSICSPATTAQLTAVTSGGTWTAQTGNPTNALIGANGNVTGMTTAGIYKFIYSVTGGGQTCTDTAQVEVKAKPNAGTDQTLACVNAVNNTLATSTTLVPSPSGGTWLGLSSNPAVVTISGNAVSGMSVAGMYQFEYSLNGCKDTVSITVELCAGCVKPNAGIDVSICSPATTAQLTAVTSGATWTAQVGNPTTANIDVNGNVTGMITAGVYKFTYSVTGGGQTCTDTAQVEVKAKPNAGTDQTLACVNAVNNTLATSTTLVPSPSGGIWLGLSSNPAVATISGNAVSGMSVAGTYQFEYTLNGCKDTVSVTVEPCAGCVKPNAGNDVSICSPATTAQLTAVTTGGTWTAQTGNPTTASIDANGNVTGMTTAGVYKFIYSVTGGGQTCTDTVQVEVKAKPNAGTDQTLACVNAVNNTLATSTTLVPSPAGGTWLGLSSNPAVATISGNAVSGMSVAGTYQFEYTLNGCKDTVLVTVEPCAGCVKPNAGNDISICSPATTAQLTAITSGGTWTAQTGNPSTASIDVNGNVTGMTVAGVYKFIYSVTGGGQTCTDTAQVEVKAKPNAGVDTVLTCISSISPTTLQLTGTSSGGTWISSADNPTGATISSSGLVTVVNSITNEFKFIYLKDGCSDTMSLFIQACVPPKGSLGHFIWIDSNNNGIQDETTPNAGGVSGVQVQLYKNGVLFATDTTDITGKYLFTNLDAGTYKIKVVTSSLPVGYGISLKNNTGDDAEDSDVNATTGESADYIIDPANPSQRNIFTVDAALIVANQICPTLPICLPLKVKINK